ncbi:hypothetical protein KI387_042228, partial [Taxus chinensis]
KGPLPVTKEQTAARQRSGLLCDPGFVSFLDSLNIPSEQNSRADSLAGYLQPCLNPDQPPAFFRQGDYKVEM